MRVRSVKDGNEGHIGKGVFIEESSVIQQSLRRNKHP